MTLTVFQALGYVLAAVFLGVYWMSCSFREQRIRYIHNVELIGYAVGLAIGLRLICLSVVMMSDIPYEPRPDKHSEARIDIPNAERLNRRFPVANTGLKLRLDLSYIDKEDAGYYALAGLGFFLAAGASILGILQARD